MPSRNRTLHKPPKQAAKRSVQSLVIERVYRPDTERQIVALCALLGLLYTAPKRKEAWRE